MKLTEFAGNNSKLDENVGKSPKSFKEKKPVEKEKLLVTSKFPFSHVGNFMDITTLLFCFIVSFHWQKSQIVALIFLITNSICNAYKAAELFNILMWQYLH